MTKVDIRLLGGSKFYLGNGTEHIFTTKKAQALLIFFVVNAERRYSRETLCELLWSRSADEQARGSLRQALTQIRRALKETPLDNALTDKNGLGLSLTGASVDIAKFDTLCDADEIGFWKQASDHYTGEFLEGFSINEAGFESWATEQRSYYHERAVATQKKIITSLVTDSIIDETVAACRRLLVLEEFDEWAVCHLMQAYAALGRRPDSVKLYQNYSRKLKEELDADPGTEAESLFQSILKGEQTAPAVVAEPKPTAAQKAAALTDWRPVIGVLPFENSSAHEKEEYLADGLTEDIIFGLSRSPVLRVLDRNQSFGSKGLEKESSATILKDANYILRGSVSIENNRIRIGAGLAESKSKRICWARRYERPFTDLFSVQTDIMSSIVSVIEPIIINQEQEIAQNVARDGEDSLEQWHLLMKARWHFWKTNPSDNQEAQTLLVRALALKPHDVTTLVTLAFTQMIQAWAFWDDDLQGSVEAANKYARAAVKADYLDPWAHFAMGSAYSCQGDIQSSIAEQRHALELNPYFASATGELARLYAFSGDQAQEALRCARTALDASPADPHANLWRRSMGLAYLALNDADKALEAAIEAATQIPHWFQNQLLLCVCHHESGNMETAKRSLDAALKLCPNYNLEAFTVGHPFQRAEDRERFLTALSHCDWIY